MKIKEKILVFFSVIALAFAVAISMGTPSSAYAQEDKGQFVSTTCIELGGGSWPCNNCDSGDNDCHDHSCTDCNPGISPE